MDIIVAVQKHLNSLSVMNGTPLERRRKLLVAFLQQGLILAIIAWGSYIRLFALGEPSFWIDEAFSIELAHSIAQTDNWFSLKDSDGDWLRGPIYHNLLAVVIQFFGESEASTRWPSVLAGILLMVVLAFFCWQYIQPRVAVIAVLLLSTGYWQIAWSRQAREYMLLTVVIWFVFYLIQVFWKGSSQKTLKAISILLLTVVAGCIHLFGLIIIVA
ncbi:MAG: hypothetical protein GY694_04680, partial [Gammaproteobacteria bacterium]|nr:hypothetical protein [Gammaproteobacteria bacterium]